MADRDAILAAVDLRSLADDLLGPRAGRSESPTWRCPDAESPWHAEASTKVTTFLTRRGEQRWHCHGCGTGGTAIDLVMRRRGGGVRQALEFLAARTEPAGRTNSPPGRTRTPNLVHEPSRMDLDSWAAHAHDLLWQSYGDPVRIWLTNARGIPDDVLRINRIGATAITPDHMLPTRRAVPGHRSASPAAVLPVIAKGRAIHAQLRLIDPGPGQPAYVSLPPSPRARHPRLGLYRPARRQHPEILVTNGVIDALSANAAGYRAAAVLSPGLVDAEVAVHLSRLDGPLVLVLGPDSPANEAAGQLAHFLTARGRRPALLSTLDGDVNDALVAAGDWPRKLTAHVRQASPGGPPGVAPTL
jgi:hypothetical protein